MTTGAGAWNDAQVERALVLSGKRIRLLSDARKMRIRAALLAENSRLSKLILRKPATRVRPRRSLLNQVLDAFSPRMLRPLATLGTLILLGGSYVMLGGQRLSPTAALYGGAIVQEARQGPFGVTWYLSRGGQTYNGDSARLGDDIVTSSPLTLTYSDGSQIVAQTGAHFHILENGNGVVLTSGRISSAITPRQPGQPRFVVQSEAGLITVKGTQFDLDMQPGVALVLRTEEGVVSAKNDKQEIDVSTGEELEIKPGEALVSKLQVPRLSIAQPGRQRIVSNRADIGFAARIVPEGVLIAIGKDGREFARFTANSAGQINEKLVVPAEGRVLLQFLQESPDGKRRSALSEPLDIEYNSQAFTLRVDSLRRDGQRVTITGNADPGSTVTVDGVGVTVGADGAFAHAFTIRSGQSQVEIVSTDSDNGSTKLLQSIE